jgi:hypothetical protein
MKRLIDILYSVVGEKGAEIIHFPQRGDARITNGQANGFHGDSDGFYSDSIEYSYKPQEMFTKCEYCQTFSRESEVSCTKCGAPLWK